LLPDGAPQRATWLNSQVLAWALGSNKSSGEVHGYPLDLLNPYFKAPVEGEPNIALMKAGRLAFDKCACMQPNLLLPGPGATAVDSNIYTKASVLLKGEQNIKLPCVGCEQYAAPCVPQPLSILSLPLLPLSSNTHARGIVPGEHVADPCFKVPESPSLCEDPPDEPGGVGLGPIHAAEKVGGEPIKCTPVKASKPGRASLDANGTPAPTEGTTNVELEGRAVKATTAQPEVLDP